jgi:hypothetical protein
METTTELSIESHLLDLIEEWKADLFDLNFKDADGWNDGNRIIASAQYAYIKFGLILEKIRNQCAYKYCEDKLKTFAQFCRQKLKLTVWQANSYIEAADTTPISKFDEKLSFWISIAAFLSRTWTNPQSQPMNLF